MFADKGYFENDYCKLWIKDEILYSMFRPFLYITPEVAKIWVNDRITYTQNVTYPMMVDISNTKFITIETKDYLEKAEAWTNVSAVAYFATSQTEKMMWNLFLKLNKPPLPSEMFMSKTEALHWLKKNKK